MSLLGRSFCLSKPVQPGTRLRSGEKGEKNRRAKRAGRQSDGGGNVAPPFPPPQATARLISFADIFPIWPRFLPFSPTAEPGPGLMPVTLWNLRNYRWRQNHSFMPPTHHRQLQTTEMNIEKLLGLKICFNLRQVYHSLLSFVFVVSFTPSSNCVWAVILKFYSIRYPAYQRFFLACGEELRRPQAEDTSVTETKNRAWKASAT